MKHMLVSTDFSMTSRNVCEYAVLLSRDFGARITLVQCIFPTLVIDDISAASKINLSGSLKENP